MHLETVSFERRVIMALASLYAFRMLGLFMVLPILMLYGDQYEGSSPGLLGLALGAYGFSQALLQIPFGVWSDKIGRKPVIAMGLLVFIVGSLIAASAESIYGLIFGRFLQGCGAISSAVMALLADLTTDENRSKAMASIGASIGVSFAVALIVGPLLAAWFGFSSLFWLTAILGCAGIYILYYFVPTINHTAKITRKKTVVSTLLVDALQSKDLLRLNLGIFVLHFVLMASFVVLPGILEHDMGVLRQQHWLIYLPLLAGSFVVMLPFMILAEKKRKIKTVFLTAIILLAASEFWLAGMPSTLPALLVGLFVFFMAFNLLEATLPSLVSKMASVEGKGAATGIYSTCQFFGAFCGGVTGGWVMQNHNVTTVFWVCSSLVIVWCCAAFSMSTPKYLASMMLPLNGLSASDVTEKLNTILGIKEIVIVESEHMIYLKVDSKTVDSAQIKAVLHNSIV